MMTGQHKHWDKTCVNLTLNEGYCVESTIKLSRKNSLKNQVGELSKEQR